MKHKKKKRLIIAIILCLAFFILPIVGFNLYIIINTPSKYMIKTKNRFDYQEKNECSGYSSAFVIRSFLKDASGLDLYNRITSKNEDGTVAPDKLVEFLINEGYNAKIHHGTLYQLKHAISKGTPVIVFVRTQPSQNYYHYLPIVGYDKNNIYAAESLKEMVNEDSEYYNRSIKKDDFLKMWETEIVDKNTYITISEK